MSEEEITLDHRPRVISTQAGQDVETTTAEQEGPNSATHGPSTEPLLPWHHPLVSRVAIQLPEMEM